MLTAPTDMKDVIARYNTGIRQRILDIVASATRAGAQRPSYVSDLAAAKTLPPIMYPTTMLNVAVNYREHDVEMSQVREAAPGQTTPTAGSALDPYMFLNATAAVTAHGEAIRLPPGRTQVDWECEIGVVVGREAHRVTAAQASDYIQSWRNAALLGES